MECNVMIDNDWFGGQEFHCDSDSGYWARVRVSLAHLQIIVSPRNERGNENVNMHIYPKYKDLFSLQSFFFY